DGSLADQSDRSDVAPAQRAAADHRHQQHANRTAAGAPGERAVHSAPEQSDDHGVHDAAPNDHAAPDAAATPNDDAYPSASDDPAADDRAHHAAAHAAAAGCLIRCRALVGPRSLNLRPAG